MEIVEFARKRPWVPALILIGVVVIGAAAARLSTGPGEEDGSARFGLTFEGYGPSFPGVLEIDALRGHVCTTFESEWATVAQIHRGDGDADDPVIITVFEPPREPLPRTCATGISPGFLVEIVRNPNDYFMDLHEKIRGGRRAVSRLE